MLASELSPTAAMPGFNELIVDSFAGGGGASTGIEMALKAMGYDADVDIAVNHNGAALAMHEANHPTTLHMEADIWTVDPLASTKGRPVGLLWTSPDCTQFSRAKGGTPVSAKIRGLAWSVANWAEQVSPRVILLENVEEFLKWGPLMPHPTKPGELIADPAKAGETFRAWSGKIRKLGYKMEWKVLKACDYGAPTIRKRLHIIMRRDGEKIVWPTPTHGDPKSHAVKSGKLLPWRTAAEIIDWTRPCPSILMSREEAREYTRATGQIIKRPLADNTMARIAAGVLRYVLQAERPFIVTCNHDGGFRGQGLDAPFSTVMPKDAYGLVVPHLSTFYGTLQNTKLERPLPTVTTENHFSVVETNIAPFITSYYGEGDGRNDRAAPMDEPLRTIPTQPRHGLVVPHIMTMRNSGKPYSAADEPTHTVTAGGAGLSVVEAEVMPFITYGQQGGSNRSAEAPLQTVTASDGDTNCVATVAVAPFVTAHYGSDIGSPADAPMRTITGIPKTDPVVSQLQLLPLTPEQEASARRVSAFLREHGAWDDREFVTIGDYVVVDIGMRMLTPRELARAQGFPEDYILAAPFNGGVLSETEQRHKIGNSVCPPVAAAIVAANYTPIHREVERVSQGWLFESEAA